MSTVSAIGRFPARKLVGVLISVSLIATALATWWSVRDLAAWLAVELAAASLGALLGFLIGLPGKAPGEAGNPEGSQTGGRQSEVQWHRISVFSDWIAGGAFALALSNGGTIGRVIVEVSAWTVAEDTNSLTGGERTQQVALVAFSVAYFIAAFIVAWWQTTTNGYHLLARARTLS